MNRHPEAFGRLVAAVGRLVVLPGAVFLCACGQPPPEGSMQAPPTAVSVAEIVERNVVEWDDFTGRIEAVDSVELRPRVAGYLGAVHFREGGLVAAGDLLFTIDDREYKASAAVAGANVARAETRLKVAQQEVERGEKLQAARALSQEEQERRRGELQQAEADLNTARAQLEQSQLSVEFARITAPIDGRIGAALVKPGNLVTPDTTLLTTLVSTDPVHVTFEGDERIYLKYQAQARNGERPSSRDVRNPVRVALAGDEGFPHRGEMDFVDNQMDPATGTIRGRAVLPNPDGLFTPGLFARIRLLGSGEYPALLVHDMAVLTDQDRKYVYVIGEGNVAERRDVVLGRSIEGLRVVKRGLNAGDRVVVNGVRKIFYPGAPLAPTLVPMDDPLAAPAPQGQAASGN